MSLLPEISQASTEINKLVAQANIHQTIAPVNPAAFTDPADTLLLASRDPVIREVSVGMTGEAYSDYSVSGTPPLSLPNSLGKPLKAWSVDVLPYQEGSGDPAPDNVRPIHGTDKLTITTAGKNLAHIFVDGYVPSINDGQLVPANGARSDYIPVLPNTDYVLSIVEPTRTIYLFYYDENKQFIRYGNGSVSIYVNTSTNIRYIMVRISGYVDTDGVMLEQSATPTTYEPYQGNTYTITLPQTVYTGTIGSEGGESRWGKIVFDGTEPWAIGSAGEGFWTACNSLVKLTDYSNAIICDKLKAYPSNGSTYYTNAESGITGYVSSGYPNQNWIYAKVPNVTNATEFKAWLAQNPVMVVFVKVTPTPYTFTPTEVSTSKGDNYAWATAEDGTVDGMEVTYVGKA